MIIIMKKFSKWIFDLDGTLTQNNLDFDRIRNELNIPKNILILEYLKQLPAKEAHELQEKLAVLEHEMISETKIAPGAVELLSLLQSKNFPLAILTRNTKENAIKTLEQIALSAYFSWDTIIGRREATPKPSSDGINLILSKWKENKDDCVIVGDFYLDIESGQNAGINTIYVNEIDDCSLANFSFKCLGDIIEKLS